MKPANLGGNNCHLCAQQNCVRPRQFDKRKRPSRPTRAQVGDHPDNKVGGLGQPPGKEQGEARRRDHQQARDAGRDKGEPQRGQRIRGGCAGHPGRRGAAQHSGGNNKQGATGIKKTPLKVRSGQPTKPSSQSSWSDQGKFRTVGNVFSRLIGALLIRRGGIPSVLPLYLKAERQAGRGNLPAACRTLGLAVSRIDDETEDTPLIIAAFLHKTLANWLLNIDEHQRAIVAADTGLIKLSALADGDEQETSLMKSDLLVARAIAKSEISDDPSALKDLADAGTSAVTAAEAGHDINHNALIAACVWMSICTRKGSIDEARVHIQRTEEFISKLDDDEKSNHRGLTVDFFSQSGSFERQVGNLAKALDHFEMAKEHIAPGSPGSRAQVAYIQSNIGNAYSQFEMNDEAEQAFLEALRQFDAMSWRARWSTDNSWLRWRINGRIAGVYSSVRKKSEFYKHTRQFMKIYGINGLLGRRPTPSDRLSFFGDIGLGLQRIGDQKGALKIFKLAFKDLPPDFSENNDLNDYFRVLLNYSHLLDVSGNHDQAVTVRQGISAVYESSKFEETNILHRQIEYLFYSILQSTSGRNVEWYRSRSLKLANYIDLLPADLSEPWTSMRGNFARFHSNWLRYSLSEQGYAPEVVPEILSAIQGRTLVACGKCSSRSGKRARWACQRACWALVVPAACAAAGSSSHGCQSRRRRARKNYARSYRGFATTFRS